jgi:hypothetical protein
MDKITIEKINGVPHTVVWHDGVQANIASEEGWYNCYTHKISIDGNGKVIATALPPLPRNPTADDAKLLHLYEAHGLHPTCFRGDINQYCLTTGMNISQKLTHAIDEQGNKVEVAICD